MQIYVLLSMLDMPEFGFVLLHNCRLISIKSIDFFYMALKWFSLFLLHGNAWPRNYSMFMAMQSFHSHDMSQTLELYMSYLYSG